MNSIGSNVVWGIGLLTLSVGALFAYNRHKEQKKVRIERGKILELAKKLKP